MPMSSYQIPGLTLQVGSYQAPNFTSYVQPGLMPICSDGKFSGLSDQEWGEFSGALIPCIEEIERRIEVNGNLKNLQPFCKFPLVKASLFKNYFNFARIFTSPSKMKNFVNTYSDTCRSHIVGPTNFLMRVIRLFGDYYGRGLNVNQPGIFSVLFGKEMEDEGEFQECQCDFKTGELYGKLDNATQTAAKHQTNLNTCRGEKEKLEKEKKDIQSSLKNETTKATGHETDLNICRGEKEKLEKEKKDIQSSLKNETTKATGHETDLNICRGEKEKLEKEKKDIQSNLKNEATKATGHETNLKTCRGEKEKLEKEKKDIQSNLKNETTKATGHETNLKTCRGEKEKLEKEKKDIQSNLKNETTKATDYKNKLNICEEERDTFKTQLMDVQKRLNITEQALNESHLDRTLFSPDNPFSSIDQQQGGWISYPILIATLIGLGIGWVLKSCSLSRKKKPSKPDIIRINSLDSLKVGERERIVKEEKQDRHIILTIGNRPGRNPQDHLPELPGPSVLSGSIRSDCSLS